MKAYLVVSLALASASLWAQGTLEFKANLTGADAVPPNDSASTAWGRIILEGNALGVEIFQEVPSLGGDAYLQGATGETLFSIPSSAVIFLPPYNEGGPLPGPGEEPVGGGPSPVASGGADYYRGGFNLSDRQVVDLLAGRLFAALGSPTYPNGEIRGQILLTSAPPTPTFIVQPFPRKPRVIRGDTVTLTAAAISSPAPSLQWQFSADSNRWSDISGATETSYTIASAQSTNAGYYRLLATNSVGAAASAGARLDYFATGSQPITNLRWTSSGFQFMQTEVQGYTYIIYASTNIAAPFSNWVAISTNVAGTNLIADPDSTSYPQRFYRSMLVP